MRFGKTVVTLVSLALCLVLAPRGALAGMSGPASIKDTRATDRQLEVEKVRLALSSDKVRERLLDMGYDADRLSDSLDKLDKQELADVAADLEGLQSGGDAIVLLLLIIALFMIIYLSEDPRAAGCCC